jgi:hypothetical protein
MQIDVKVTMVFKKRNFEKTHIKKDIGEGYKQKYESQNI